MKHSIFEMLDIDDNLMTQIVSMVTLTKCGYDCVPFFFKSIFFFSWTFASNIGSLQI